MSEPSVLKKLSLVNNDPVSYILCSLTLPFSTKTLTFLFFVAYGSYKDIFEAEDKANKAEISRLQSEKEQEVALVKQGLMVSEHKEQMWRQLLKERASGFPSLFENIATYEKLIDDHLSNFLRTKPHSAVSASELVKVEAKRRREAEFIQRKTQSIIEYYESIAPFLLDYKEQEIDERTSWKTLIQ